MKKIVMGVMAAILVASLTVGCAKEEQPQVTPEFSQEVADNASEVSGQVQEADSSAPEDASPTTGLAGHPEYKPVIVQVENEKPARPQAGLQEADIVYETLIEGNDTRFTCVFNDTYPQEVGPLRSARYYHQFIQQEWDALFVHMGGTDDQSLPSITYIYGDSGEHIKQRLNPTRSDPPESQVWRRSNGKAFEHTAYVNVEEIADTYEYEPEQRPSFKFYPLESYDNYESAKDINEVHLAFWQNLDFVSYEYDADKDKLIRYMGGEPFIAEETESAVEVQNLIIQYCNIGDLTNAAGIKEIDLFGTGRADFIIHGKHLQGTWVRDSREDVTVYYLDSGEELTFAPGNTWIEIAPNNKEVQITYTDGSVYNYQ